MSLYHHNYDYVVSVTRVNIIYSFTKYIDYDIYTEFPKGTSVFPISTNFPGLMNTWMNIWIHE